MCHPSLQLQQTSGSNDTNDTTCLAKSPSPESTPQTSAEQFNLVLCERMDNSISYSTTTTHNAIQLPKVLQDAFELPLHRLHRRPTFQRDHYVKQ